MAKLSHEQVRPIWEQLKRRNDWEIVTDEAAFFAEVDAECGDITNGTSEEGQIRLAIKRAYSRYIYRGLFRREERAAQEIWLFIVRLSLRDGKDRATAEDLAQEAIARILEKLPDLRAPESLLSWADMIFRTVRRDSRRKTDREQRQPIDDEGQEQEPADPVDQFAEAEQSILATEFERLLQRKVANELERTVLRRHILYGDNPRDIAHELGLPLSRTRVAKNRALKRLRNDEEFKQFVLSLRPDGSFLEANTGADDDDT